MSAEINVTSKAFIDALVEKIASRTALIVLSQLDPRLHRPAGGAQSSARSAGASEDDAYEARQASRSTSRDARPPATVTDLHGGKPASESQVKRLGDIRKADKLWGIIDGLTAPVRVQKFEELTSAQAQAALDTFYEQSGGRRAAGGR